MDQMEGALKVYLDKGDALLFVDALSHGSATRANPGECRVVIYRYGPSWGVSRYGYFYSKALLDQLTPNRRKNLQTIPPRLPEIEQINQSGLLKQTGRVRNPDLLEVIIGSFRLSSFLYQLSVYLRLFISHNQFLIFCEIVNDYFVLVSCYRQGKD